MGHVAHMEGEGGLQGGNLQKRDHMEDLGIDGHTILN